MSKHWSNTEYKNVYRFNSDVENKPLFKARIIKHGPCYFDNVKDAAKQVDRWLIDLGKEPVNILRKN